MDMAASTRQIQDQVTSSRGTQYEHRCVDSLKQAMKNGDSKAEVKSLQDLGDVHLDKGKVRRHGRDFTRASALYNAALVRCKESQVRETLIHRIKYTEKQFLKRVAKVNKHDAAMYDYQTDLNHKAELTRIRDMCRERLVSIATMCDYSENPMEHLAVREREKGRAGAVRELYRDITQEMRGFITSLVEEWFPVLGRPPCKYAMIGMGSFARQEMTPYSDLEFAILVEEGKGTEENKTYFRILTHLLHLKVLNLGETILPSMAIPYLNDFENQQHNWLYDSVTPRGFSFDGAMPWASKTPLGRGKTKKKAALELIATPREMAELQTEERSVKEGYHLADVLSKVDLITGDGDILTIYDELVSQKLDEKFPNSSQITIGRNRVMLSFIAIMSNYGLNETLPMSGELYDVKQVVYRFLSLSFRHIGDLCGTAGKTLTDIIDELQKGKVLTSFAAHNVRVAAAIADEIRLRTYCTYDKQREHMAIVKPLHTSIPAVGEIEAGKAGSTPEHRCTETKPGEKQRKAVANSTTEASVSPHRVYHIDDSNLLHRFYMTVLPLRSLLCTKLLLWGSEENLNLLFGQLMREVFSGQSLYGGALERGKAFRILQQRTRAEECFRKALQEDPNNDDLVIELAEMLSELGKTSDVQQLLRPVLDRMEQSLDNDSDNDSDVAAKTQRFRKVLESASLFGDFVLEDVGQYIHRHFLAQVSASDVSKLDQAKGYSSIAFSFAMSGDREQSELYLHRALEKLDSEPDPGVKILHKLKRAQALTHIAVTHHGLKSAPEHIIKYAQLAREAYRECVGADTPHVGFIICMFILGEANEWLEDWTKVIEWFEQVMEMASALGGEAQFSTFIVMVSLLAMGKAYLQLGEVGTGLELLQQAEGLIPETWEDLDAPIQTTALKTIYAYGSALDTTGRVAEARQRFQRILDLPVKSGASTSMTKAKSSAILAGMFQQSGHIDIAIEYNMQSYSLYAQVFKNDLRDVVALELAMTQTSVKGMMELGLGKFGAAVQSFSTALELLDSTDIDIRRAFPTESERITRYRLLALVYSGYGLFRLSDLHRATAAYTKAVDTFRDFYGADARHPVLACCLTAKGRLHHTQGDSETAKKCYNEVLEMITGETTGLYGYLSVLPALTSFCVTLNEPSSPSDMDATALHLMTMIKPHRHFFAE